jgi:hypothetical protein
LIVENEFIPPGGIRRTFVRQIYYRLALIQHRLEHLPLKTPSTVEVRTTRQISGDTTAAPFPSHDTKLRFLATDNPKKSGTAAWARLDNYLKTKPAIVRQFMDAGDKSEDIRYDLWQA